MSRLSTQRLTMRPLERADVGALVSWYTNPDLMAFIGDGTAYTEAETQAALLEHIDQTARDGFGLMLAELRHGGLPIGRVGFKEWDIDGTPMLEIGWLVAPEHQRSGYATEAGMGLRDHGFNELDREVLISLVHRDNSASRRVVEKVGGSWWRDWTTPGGSDVVLYRYERERARSGGDVDEHR